MSNGCEAATNFRDVPRYELIDPKPTALKRRTSNPPSDACGARTKLGGILKGIRGEIVASGIALLNWRQLDRELVGRRGDAKDEAGA